MQTTAVSATESVVSVPTSIAVEPVVEPAALGRPDFITSWFKRAAGQIGRIRLPRMEGHRPETAIISMGSDTVPKAGAPFAAPEGKTGKHPLAVRRGAVMPKGEAKIKIGAQFRSSQPAALEAPRGSDSDSAATGVPPLSDPEGPPTNVPKEDFAVEELRFQALRFVDYKKVLGKPTYLVEELEAHLVHPSLAGHHQMVAHDLAARLHNSGKEKPVDAVVCYNDALARGPFFAHSLAEALIREYGEHGLSQEIALHVLAKKPTEPDEKEEYQLAGKWSPTQHPLASKRVLLAVPSITPHNWPSVSQQVLYLRGCVGHLRVVSIARVGRLPAQGRAGVQIEAFTSYGV